MFSQGSKVLLMSLIILMVSCGKSSKLTPRGTDTPTGEEVNVSEYEEVLPKMKYLSSIQYSDSGKSDDIGVKNSPLLVMTSEILFLSIPKVLKITNQGQSSKFGKASLYIGYDNSGTSVTYRIKCEYSSKQKTTYYDGTKYDYSESISSKQYEIGRCKTWDDKTVDTSVLVEVYDNIKLEIEVASKNTLITEISLPLDLYRQK